MESGGGDGEKKIKHYSSHHQILLVGEGDFSFAACLATAFGHASNIIATSLDSEVQLANKHSTAAANLVKLKDKACKIIHEVNVSSMYEHPLLKGKLFNRIVFNFPHAGYVYRIDEHDNHQIELHRDVVRGFMENASKMVTVEGEVHVTHKTTRPFSMWKIEELGEEAGLSLIEKSSFDKWEYMGYHNKRSGDVYSRSNKTFRVGECSTFKFGQNSFL